MSDFEKEPLDIPTSSPPLFGSPLTLQVGERRFVTTAETLMPESGFFASLLSGRCDNTQADGSHFIDADGDLFEHILRYLRRGVLPLFYDKVKGHDYALYVALLEEAKYFQIPRLREWIENKTYLQAVKVTQSIAEFDCKDTVSAVTTANVETEYVPAWKTRKVYVCPRRIVIHRSNQDACGRQCKIAQGDAEDEYVDEVVLKVMAIRKQTTLDAQICVEGR